ncbi:poly-gamma-glutamate hydrolase family protein [Haloarculaceae archaeon H-GB2-1]|nr:poly-gamma-glutamate hydrolase family protein [Haloarculaceae archaeon H-GB2-1]
MHDPDASAEIRVAKKGRQRLGITPPADVVISRTVPRAYLTRMEAFEQNAIAETLWDRPGQDTLLICAPHAGAIESNTAQAAGIVRKRLGPEHASAYMVHGFGEEAFSRFHITTSEMAPESYPGVATIADRDFTHCITFHVWNGDEILIGGLADTEFRKRLADRVADATNGKRKVVTDHSQGKYMASTETNLVNRLTADGASGIQIEMPPVIAHRYRKRVARAVGDFYEDEIAAESSHAPQ